MSHGETNIPTLLSTMDPMLDPETYVFLSTTTPLNSLPLHTLQPQMIFQESEGLTLITTKAIAETHHYDNYTFPCRKISLKVHSSLEAVGLVATISTKLAAHGISTNVVSGFFHDHVFVPEGREGDAMGALVGMMNGES
ncbi:ACT domain-containing protein [Aspergillus pseudotamarii]|uniref:ACT domain-containing protein n=1 Tax=Aspergillus pseudotamarii TaxID=132259 RepID=A0A5N6TCD0_ASPPS|nr:ACT domain-containing protein [Aspergillus pseudotamarii]KAE8144044.1 ACT domain-containing protein [Aspergillus pseudotamarii]